MVRRTYPSGVKDEGGDSSPDDDAPNSHPQSSSHPASYPLNSNNDNLHHPRRSSSPIFSAKQKAPRGPFKGSGNSSGGAGANECGRDGTVSRTPPPEYLHHSEYEQQGLQKSFKGSGNYSGGAGAGVGEHGRNGTVRRTSPPPYLDHNEYEQQRLQEPFASNNDVHTRVSAWDTECANPSKTSIRDELIRDKPQRPWFYSGNSARTDAVVRQEVAARRSGPGGSSSSLGVFQPYTKGNAKAFSGGGGGLECGGGGDRSRGGGGGGGGAAGRGVYFSELGETGDWRDRERRRPYGSGGYSVLSRYTSSDNGSSAVWNQNPRMADVLYRTRTAEGLQAQAENNGVVSNSGEQRQQPLCSRRESCFSYPVVDEQNGSGMNDHYRSIPSSTIFPDAMVRRFHFFRSSASELDKSCRVPQLMPHHRPAGHVKLEADNERDHCITGTHAAAAVSGWRPVWNEYDTRRDGRVEPRDGSEDWHGHRGERGIPDEGTDSYRRGREWSNCEMTQHRGRLPGARAAEQWGGRCQRQDHGAEEKQLDDEDARAVRIAEPSAVMKRVRRAELLRSSVGTAEDSDRAASSNWAMVRPPRVALTDHDDMMILAAVARRDLTSSSAVAATRPMSAATPPPLAPTVPREPRDPRDVSGHDRSRTSQVSDYRSGGSSFAASSSPYRKDSSPRVDSFNDGRDVFQGKRKKLVREGDRPRKGDNEGGERIRGSCIVVAAANDSCNGDRDVDPDDVHAWGKDGRGIHSSARPHGTTAMRQQE